MDRVYKEYDPFIMKYNVRKVYYVPYPSIQPSKWGWCVVIKSNPMGYIETNGVMEYDVTYQDDEQEESRESEDNNIIFDEDIEDYDDE